MVGSVSDVLSARFSKDVFIKHLNENPKNFQEAFELSLQSKPKISWRAAWVLNHCLKPNDPRTQKFIPSIIAFAPTAEDGHQRELLKILENSTIPEDQEGTLFDICVTIWEDVSKSPSVRMVAFRVMLKIVKSFPELINEIDFLVQNHYLDTLSPGIKRSLIKALAKTKKTL